MDELENPVEEHWYDKAMKRERLFNKILLVTLSVFVTVGFIGAALIKKDPGLCLAIILLGIWA